MDRQQAVALKGYAKPTLTSYGSIAQLSQGGPSTGADSGGKQPRP